MERVFGTTNEGKVRISHAKPVVEFGISDDGHLGVSDLFKWVLALTRAKTLGAHAYRSRARNRHSCKCNKGCKFDSKLHCVWNVVGVRLLDVSWEC